MTDRPIGYKGGVLPRPPHTALHAGPHRAVHYDEASGRSGVSLNLDPDVTD